MMEALRLSVIELQAAQKLVKEARKAYNIPFAFFPLDLDIQATVTRLSDIYYKETGNRFLPEHFGDIKKGEKFKIGLIGCTLPPGNTCESNGDGTYKVSESKE